MSNRFFRNDQGVATVTPGSGFTQASTVNLMNRVTTGWLRLRMRATLTVAGAVTGPVRNRGLISSALQMQVREGGNATYGLARLRLMRVLAEASAAQSLVNVTTAPSGASLAIGDHTFDETFDISFADRRAVNPMETGYREANPASFFDVQFRTIGSMAATIACIVDVGASACTMSDITVEVEQMGDAAPSTLPFCKPWYQEVSLPVNGASANAILYLLTQSRVRSLIIAPEVTMADGGVVAVDDVISALRLIGDEGRNAIGPNQTPWEQLVNGQAATQGGYVDPAAFIADFQVGGWLSRTIVPRRDFPNFRTEMAVAPSATAGSTQIVVGINELVRSAPNSSGYPTVTAPADTPAWLQ